MEDGQDHQIGGEAEAESASMPLADRPSEPSDEAADVVAAYDVTSEGPDEASLTGVLAALSEPDPDETPAHDEPVGSDALAPDATPDAPESELAALQADLEAEEAVVQAAPEVPAAEAAEAVPAPGAAPAAEAPSATAAEAPSGTAAVPAEPVAQAAPVAAAAHQAYAAPEALAFPDGRPGVPIWPFLVYFGTWVVFAGLLMWQFVQAPAGVPLYELALYGPSILAGLFLTALGPLLAIGVWLMLWIARPGARAGLFSRAFILGAVVTLAGVALWLVALGAVDMLRLGRLI